MNELNNSNDEMDDFTNHFIECFSSNKQKNSDRINEKDYKELNDLLQRIIDSRKEETLFTKLFYYFNEFINSIKQALILTK